MKLFVVLLICHCEIWAILVSVSLCPVQERCFLLIRYCMSDNSCYILVHGTEGKCYATLFMLFIPGFEGQTVFSLDPNPRKLLHPSVFYLILSFQNTCIKLIQEFKYACLKYLTELLHKKTISVMQLVSYLNFLQL